jgi:hypothetical protein
MNIKLGRVIAGWIGLVLALWLAFGPPASGGAASNAGLYDQAKQAQGDFLMTLETLVN